MNGHRRRSAPAIRSSTKASSGVATGIGASPAKKPEFNYQTIIRATNSFNSRLVLARNQRLPFIDNQTGVAQRDCALWHSERERIRCRRQHHQDEQPSAARHQTSQLYSYPDPFWLGRRQQRGRQRSGDTGGNSDPKDEKNFQDHRPTLDSLETPYCSSLQTTLVYRDDHRQDGRIGVVPSIKLKLNQNRASPFSLFESHEANQSIQEARTDNRNTADADQRSPERRGNGETKAERQSCNLVQSRSNKSGIGAGTSFRRSESSLLAATTSTSRSANGRFVSSHRVQAECRAQTVVVGARQTSTSNNKMTPLHDEEVDGEIWPKAELNQTVSDCSDSSSNAPVAAQCLRPYVCPICDQTYKTRPGLSYHFIHAHDTVLPRSLPVKLNGSDGTRLDCDETTAAANGSAGDGGDGIDRASRKRRRLEPVEESTRVLRKFTRKNHQSVDGGVEEDSRVREMGDRSEDNSAAIDEPDASVTQCPGDDEAPNVVVVVEMEPTTTRVTPSNLDESTEGPMLFEDASRQDASTQRMDEQHRRNQKELPEPARCGSSASGSTDSGMTERLPELGDNGLNSPERTSMELETKSVVVDRYASNNGHTEDSNTIACKRGTTAIVRSNHNGADDRDSTESKDMQLITAKKSSANLFCDFCLGTADKNRRTRQPEELISCSSCGSSGHPSCLRFSDNIRRSVKNYNWQCIECKTCSTCNQADHEDQLLFCDDCDRSYHTYCLSPRLEKPPEGNWTCKPCLNEYYTVSMT